MAMVGAYALVGAPIGALLVVIVDRTSARAHRHSVWKAFAAAFAALVAHGSALVVLAVIAPTLNPMLNSWLGAFTPGKGLPPHVGIAGAMPSWSLVAVEQGLAAAAMVVVLAALLGSSYRGVLGYARSTAVTAGTLSCILLIAGATAVRLVSGLTTYQSIFYASADGSHEDIAKPNQDTVMREGLKKHGKIADADLVADFAQERLCEGLGLIYPSSDRQAYDTRGGVPRRSFNMSYRGGTCIPFAQTSQSQRAALESMRAVLARSKTDAISVTDALSFLFSPPVPPPGVSL